MFIELVVSGLSPDIVLHPNQITPNEWDSVCGLACKQAHSVLCDDNIINISIDAASADLKLILSRVAKF
jgi:hypothetical protein